MRHALVLLFCVDAANLQAQPSAAPPVCSVAVVDSAWLTAGPVYRDCDVERPAVAKTMGRPSFAFPRELSCAIVELEFVVDSTGRPRPETARIISTNSTEYAERLLETLPRWRYAPARRAGAPVSQVVHVRHARPDERLPFVVAGQRPPPRPPRPPCR